MKLTSADCFAKCCEEIYSKWDDQSEIIIKISNGTLQSFIQPTVDSIKTKTDLNEKIKCICLRVEIEDFSSTNVLHDENDFRIFFKEKNIRISHLLSNDKLFENEDLWKKIFELKDMIDFIVIRNDKKIDISLKKIVREEPPKYYVSQYLGF